MLGQRLPKSRRYSYEPHYYDPKKEEKGNRQIKFKRQTLRRSAKSRSVVWLIILVLLVIYLVLYFSRLGPNGGT